MLEGLYIINNEIIIRIGIIICYKYKKADYIKH